MAKNVKLTYSDGQEIILPLKDMNELPSDARKVRVFGKNGKFTNHLSYDERDAKWKDSNGSDTQLNKQQFAGWFDEPSINIQE